MSASEKLVRCEGCGVHVRRESTTCPFCGRAAIGVPLRRTLAALAGAAAFVSGIGCAYGCPADLCTDSADASADGPSDAERWPDVSVGVFDAAPRDGGSDTGAGLDAALDGDTALDGAAAVDGDANDGASMDAPADAVADVASDG